MYQEFTEKDIMNKAKAIALLKSVKSHPQGVKFRYLDHCLIVDEDDYGSHTSIKVKLERTNKESKIKEIYYEHEYL